MNWNSNTNFSLKTRSVGMQLLTNKKYLTPTITKTSLTIDKLHKFDSNRDCSDIIKLRP